MKGNINLSGKVENKLVLSSRLLHGGLFLCRGGERGIYPSPLGNGTWNWAWNGAWNEAWNEAWKKESTAKDFPFGSALATIIYILYNNLLISWCET